MLDVLLYGYLSRAQIQIALSVHEAAWQDLQLAQAQADAYQVPRWIYRIRANVARFQLARGQFSEAERWMRERAAWMVQEPGELREFGDLVVARILLQRSDQTRTTPHESEVIGLLARLQTEAEAAGRTGRLIEIIVLQAVALRAQSQRERAHLILGRALALAVPEGYVRVFVDEGAPMAALLAEFRAGITKQNVGTTQIALLSAVDHLLSYFPSPAGSIAEPTTAGRQLPLIEPLSERELEVLRLLVDGLSNQAIAAKLVVALGTVKTHVHNIYGKLGTETRIQAIKRAQELGLV